MKFIRRQIYFAATLTLILFGIFKSDYVRGTDLLTATVNEENEFQPTPNILDRAITKTKASEIAETIYGIDPLPAVSKIDHFEKLLHQAILHRLGVPYRSGGIDDNGYDCSGFVWRVFRDAGVRFERSSARAYWDTMPRATKKESQQFGTLVFFDHSTHVGVVRDSYSFYHASTSNGVMRSNFSEYWGDHVQGFRRIPIDDYIIEAR